MLFKALFLFLNIKIINSASRNSLKLLFDLQIHLLHVKNHSLIIFLRTIWLSTHEFL